MKKTLQFLGYGLFSLVLLLALLLCAAPTVIESIARSQYAKHIVEGELEIDDIEVNYFTGRIQLKGVEGHKAQQQVLSLGRFEADIAMLELFDGYIVVEDVTLADFSIEVDQNKKRIIAAGYEYSLQDTAVDTGADVELKPQEQEEPVIKGVGLKRLTLDNVKIHFINAEINAHATLDSLRVENFDTKKPAQHTLLDLALSLDGIELSQQGKSFVIPSGAKLAVQAKLSQLLDEPAVLANLSLSQVAVQATDISTELLAFDTLNLSGVDYTATALKLESLQLQGLQGITADGVDKSLVEFKELLVTGIRVPGMKSLAIESIALSTLNADVVLDKNRKIEKLHSVLDYMNTPVAGQAKAVTTQAEAEQGNEDKPQDFAVSLGRLSMNGEVFFKDKAIDPAFERTIELSELVVENIDTADTANYTDLMVKASLGEYSKIDLQGQLQALAKKPSGYLKGSITGVELVPLSPYAVEATGYFIRTGTAKTDIDVSLKKAELGGEVAVLLSAIKLAPGDKGKIEKLKTSISMPLDVALGLLRDKKGDINLKLPMEGNINSPDFDLGSVMGQVSKKVLKKATIAGLKYAFQPYGAMISVGSWLGKKATAVRLDPLLYLHGDTEVNEEQKKYLSKVGEIMSNKEGLRIKLCALASPAERIALHQAALVTNPQAQPLAEAELLALSQQRTESVRKHLVEESKVDAQRLLLCQPSYDEKAEDKQSLVHLEI